MKAKGTILILIMLLASVALAQPPAQAQPHGKAAVPAGDSVFFGKTYGEWQKLWWQWALALPATSHPLFDSADCSTGQAGHVWFLGGKFCPATSGDTNACGDNMNPKAVRACTIRSGTALFFPILNGDDSIIEELPYNPKVTETDLRHNEKSWTEPNPNGFMTLATVDGRSIIPVRICTKGDYCTPAQSPLIPFTLAAHDNLFTTLGEIGITDGASSFAIGDGYYVLLPPLSVGQHTIHFYGLNGNFSLDITYNMTVLP
jgi:hypothetical protein